MFVKRSFFFLSEGFRRGCILLLTRRQNLDILNLASSNLERKREEKKSLGKLTKEILFLRLASIESALGFGFYQKQQTPQEPYLFVYLIL